MIFVCTKDTPFTSDIEANGKYSRYQHEYAVEVGEQDDDRYDGSSSVRMRCEVCGVTWRKELPD